MSCRRLYSSTGRRTAPFAPMAFPTLAFFHQRLPDRMPYALRKYPVFNQWSPCSVSLHSAPAESCRRLCSGPVDAQRLSLLGSFLHRLSSTSGCLIEWLIPFASVLHSTDGHRAVLHCFLPWQCRIDTRTLARWMYNVFCIYGAPRGSFLPLAARHLIGYQLFLLLP